MTVGEILLHAKNLNEEEIVNLYDGLKEIQSNRIEKMKEELATELRKVMLTIESKGFHVYDDAGYCIKIDDITVE